MKNSFTQFLPLLFLLVLFSACNDDDDSIDLEIRDFSALESEWVRLSLLRENEIEVIQTNTGEVVGSVNVAAPEGARYYTSNSGRYLVVTDRANSKLRFFDSGVTNHVDHGHQDGVGWLDINVAAPLPTHFTSSGGQIVIFNDGDGSLTYVNESQLELPAYEPKVISFNTVAHHGAGFRLSNGKFATTFKNTTEPGGLPQMVKYLDADGSLIDDNGGVEVAGIHGDATNGYYGVFGSTDGIILVDEGGDIDLIAYPGNLNNESGNWIGTLKGHDNVSNFFGRASKVGTFLIDPEKKSLTPLYQGDDVVGDMLSFDGEYYIVHTADNVLRVYTTLDGKLMAEQIVDMADITEVDNGDPGDPMDAMDKKDPVLVASDNYLYILGPNRVAIKVLSIKTLEQVHTINLDDAVESIAINGFTER